jgi:hypothetical protein
MYKGEPTKGIEFYNLLFKSDEFNIELGKVTLASGKLEAELMMFLQRNGVTKNISKKTLGSLIEIGNEKKLFDNNLSISLNLIAKQRNYLTHNIYALFIDLLDETILEKNNLIDTDVVTYIDRVWQLKENLISLAEIISRQNDYT